MHETPADLEALQRLLDESFEAAGAHLRRIVTPERRIDAAALAARLTGVRLLALATATADGRPIVGPVDGIFWRGAFWFGSAPDSVRFRHIRARPDVSATHIEGEPFAVTVHGRAHIHDLRDPEAAGFARRSSRRTRPATATNGSAGRSSIPTRASTPGACTRSSTRSPDDPRPRTKRGLTPPGAFGHILRPRICAPW
jgi:hypothetical protein